MKLNILEQKYNEIKVEIEGENHTIANALRKELWENKNVKVSGYNIKHGLIRNPVLVIETEKEKPLVALKKAVSGLKKKMKDLKTVFKKL